MFLLDLKFEGLMLIFISFVLVLIALIVIMHLLLRKLGGAWLKDLKTRSLSITMLYWMICIALAAGIIYFALYFHYSITGKGLLE